MKILIADDEGLVRFGLVSVLEDILPSSTDIIEVGNGVDLIDKAREFHPQIGFVDIKMPGINGLDAIEKIQQYSCDTLWVILTGHADFSYARAALKLGVEDFLLKPPDPDELKKLLKRLSSRIQEKQITANRKLESRISAVLGDTTSIKFDPYFQPHRYWQAALILWDSLLPDSVKVGIQREYATQLIGLMDEGAEYSGTLVSMRDGRLLLVFSIPVEKTAMDRIIGYWNRQFIDLKSSTESTRSRDIADTWLLTRVVTDVEEMFSEVEKLSTMTALRYLHHPGELISFSEFTGDNRIYRYIGIANLLEELSAAWETGQEDDFHGLIHNLDDAVRQIPEEKIRFDNPAWFAKFVMPLPGLDSGGLRDFIKGLHNKGHELFVNRPDQRDNNPPPKSLVEKALGIMNRRYRETIGIAQVAEELSVSPNYLSTVFKKETGSSFTRHLTDLRLDKSRELLKQTDANIGSIARSLGYQSGRHFTRLFKDRFGMTPSQWIAECRN